MCENNKTPLAWRVVYVLAAVAVIVVWLTADRL